MKKAIALATLVTVSVAQAQTNNELTFGDLNYLLKQGQFQASFDANLERSEEQTEEHLVSKRTDEKEGWALSPLFIFGAAENLNLNAGFTYNWDYETQSEPVGQHKRFYEDGIRSLNLGAVYRLMDGPMVWDLGLNGNIRLQDSERGLSLGGEASDGNAAAANHLVGLSTSVGQKWNEANEWRASAGVEYNMAGEASGELSGITNGETTAETDAALDLFLGAQYQYRPVQEFMMAFGARAVRVSEREVEQKDDVGTLEYTEESHIDMQFTFNAKYLVTESLIARFNYGQGRLQAYDVDYKDSSVGDEIINRRRSQFFGVGVDYLF